MPQLPGGDEKDKTQDGMTGHGRDVPARPAGWPVTPGLRNERGTNPAAPNPMKVRQEPMAENITSLTVTKKYLLALALQAEVEEQKARIELLKMQGADGALFGECSDRLAYLAGELYKLADADENGRR
jgi:hypothetical protein